MGRSKGSLEFYSTYPGMYVPQPIGIRPAHPARSARDIGAETLALTKMNWNQTRLDGRDPVTLRTANRSRPSCGSAPWTRPSPPALHVALPRCNNYLRGHSLGRRVIGAGGRELGVL
jgi:hypothetical protein